MRSANALRAVWLLAAAATLLSPAASFAMVDGITRTELEFAAEPAYISTPDGGALLVWTYNDLGGAVGPQYPGPTLLLMVGDVVTVTLTNHLAENVSIVFPGQEEVAATGGVTGLLTREAIPGGSVTYSFTASQPGTYLYHSGTRPDIQVEMGLLGAIVVYPAMMDHAYDHASAAFDREFLFLLTEMDPALHRHFDGVTSIPPDTTGYFPTLWFINGRAAPDTMSAAYAGWLPTQPYNCMPTMHPGEKLLMRIIGGGRDPHPFHFHGNNAWVIARDGRLLESAPGSGADLAFSDFTIGVYPGETVDALFTWTGEKIGWDIYGHEPGDPLEPGEFAPDHGKPFPVLMPEEQELTLGGGWSGSPFLGQFGPLPPNHVSENMDGGFFYMWHSHAEKEMVNDDIFPGGMMTMLLIEHPSVDIMEM